MKAYLQIDLDIVDLDGFMEYVQRIPELIQKHAGRYLVEGVIPNAVEEKGSIPQRSVLLEFPSREHAEAFLAERAASDLHDIWSKTTSSRILLLDGS